MDAVRELIVRRVAELDLDLANLSRKLKRNPTYLQQFIQYGKPQELVEDDRIALAHLLAVPEQKLRGKGRARATSRPGPRGAEPLAAGGEPTLFTTVLREVDVAASAGGGAIVEAETTSGEWHFPTSWLRHELRGKADKNGLYVITIEGDSMRGTLDDGDKVLIDIHRLHRPAAPLTV